MIVLYSLKYRIYELKKKFKVFLNPPFPKEVQHEINSLLQ